MVKPLIITTILLLTIGGGLYFYEVHYNSKFSKDINFSKQKLLEQLDTKELSQININGEGSFVSLRQLQNSIWHEHTLNYQADILSIRDLLLKISQIQLGDLITSNADYHARFQLLEPPEKTEDWDKDSHGISITLLRGDETIILSLLLGKNRKGGEGQYIRYTGSDKVYLIPEKLYINTTVYEWLNKDLLNIDSEQVAKIKLKNGSNDLVYLSRDSNESEWESQNSNNGPDKEKIKNALDRLSRLSFTKLFEKDFINEELSEIAEETLFITLFDGRIYTLKFRKNIQSKENFILSLRMGILQEASSRTKDEESNLRQEMEDFNKKMNGRFFEISSWEGKELLLRNE